MGAFNTKQWSEVLTTGSPGSPKTNEAETEATSSAPSSSENSPVPENIESKPDKDEERPKPRHRNLKSLDPRSFSEDFPRTPIQVEKSPESKVSESGSEGSDNEEDEEETDTSGQELLCTPMAIDKHLNKFKVINSTSNVVCTQGIIESFIAFLRNFFLSSWFKG